MFRKLLYVMRGGVLVAGRAKKIEPVRRNLGRRMTCDVAFLGRMPAGSPGDVTRHYPPATIEPCLLATLTPPTLFGQAVVPSGLSDNGVRLVQAGDTALTDIYGITARAFPIQQPTSSSAFAPATIGTGSLATTQPVDVLRSGYVLVSLPVGNAAPVKGGTVYVWIAASTGAHVQGGFETAASGSNTITLGTKTTWQGGLDSAGNAELAFNI
jgi:hypothetical protein